jgi:hypothetical protein
LQVGKDAVPTFKAETHPPGSAPKESTFRPNPQNEVPGQALNPDASRDETEGMGRTSALDTFPTATSKDVYNATKWGKPLQGMTSREIREKNLSTRAGLEGRGATGPDQPTVEKKVHAVRADRD